MIGTSPRADRLLAASQAPLQPSNCLVIMNLMRGPPEQWLRQSGRFWHSRQYGFSAITAGRLTVAQLGRILLLLVDATVLATSHSQDSMQSDSQRENRRNGTTLTCCGRLTASALSSSYLLSFRTRYFAPGSIHSRNCQRSSRPANKLDVV
jgi:hypothetical protein